MLHVTWGCVILCRRRHNTHWQVGVLREFSGNSRPRLIISWSSFLPSQPPYNTEYAVKKVPWTDLLCLSWCCCEEQFVCFASPPHVFFKPRHEILYGSWPSFYIGHRDLLSWPSLSFLILDVHFYAMMIVIIWMFTFFQNETLSLFIIRVDFADFATASNVASCNLYDIWFDMA